MGKIRVTVDEQPGRLSRAKARAICAYLMGYYVAHKDEVDRRVGEIQSKEAQHDSTENRN